MKFRLGGQVVKWRTARWGSNAKFSDKSLTLLTLVLSKLFIKSLKSTISLFFLIYNLGTSRPKLSRSLIDFQIYVFYCNFRSFVLPWGFVFIAYSQKHPQNKEYVIHLKIFRRYFIIDSIMSLSNTFLLLRLKREKFEE